MLHVAPVARTLVGPSFFNQRQPQPIRLRCAGKGFGEPDNKAQFSSGRKRRVVDINEVEEVVENIKKNITPPIDPEEAESGRVDYVTVKDWKPANGSHPSIDDLEVKEFIADAEKDQSAQFYYRLAKTLERLQFEGALDVESEKLRPFEEWVYTPLLYATTLLTLAKAHANLEESIAKIMNAFSPAKSINGFPLDAVRYVSAERHLDRAAEMMNDFNSFLENTPELDPSVVTPERSVKQYEGHLYKITKRALDNENAAEQIPAFGKIIAHAFLLRIMHYTSGARIAAAATEKLRLAEKKAVTAYEVYPDDILNPVRDFARDINNMGKLLSEEYKSYIFQELQIAFKLTSVFYAPLGREPDTIQSWDTL